MTTKLQSFARKRNFAKMRVRGMMATIKLMSKTEEITGNESNELVKASKIFEGIINNWYKEEKFLRMMLKK